MLSNILFPMLASSSGTATASPYTMVANAVLNFAGGDDRHSGMYSGALWGRVTTGTLTVRTLEAQ